MSKPIKIKFEYNKECIDKITDICKNEFNISIKKERHMGAIGEIILTSKIVTDVSLSIKEGDTLQIIKNEDYIKYSCINKKLGKPPFILIKI
jgi:hypothetical protein